MKGLAGAHWTAEQIPFGHRLHIIVAPQRDVLAQPRLDLLLSVNVVKRAVGL